MYCIKLMIIDIYDVTLKIAGLKTTQLGLFGNPVLCKYWTERMLGYFV